MPLTLTLLLLAPQTTWSVDASGTPPGTGTPADPYTSITYALAQASTVSGDTVEVAPGTYPNERIDFLGKAVHLIGVAGPAQTVVLGMAPTPGLDVSIIRCASGEGAGTVIEGLTLRDGFGSTLTVAPHGTARGGGAVFADGSSPRLKGCQFDGIAAVFGGAIFARDSRIQIEDCQFSAQRAVSPTPIGPAWGWALYAVGGSPAIRSTQVDGTGGAEDYTAIFASAGALLIEECSIIDNYRPNGPGGAALHSNSANVFIFSSEFRDNIGSFHGGAVRQTGGLLHIQDSDFISNETISASGAALGLRNGSCHIESSRFLSNFAFDDGWGGAISAFDHDLTCVDVVFAGNRAAVGGALEFGSGNLRMTGCTFSGNTTAGHITLRGGAAYVSGSASALFERTYFISNQVSGGITNAGGGAIYGGGAATRAEHCVFVGNTVNGLPPDGGAIENVHCENSIFRHNGPNPIIGSSSVNYCVLMSPHPGIGNVVGDPQFWPGPEYRVRPGSPAIDAGNPLSPLDPDGSRADIGPFPFDPWYCGVGCEGFVGTPTCASFPNSTGLIGQLTGLGSAVASRNLLILNGSQLPSNSLGYLLASRSPGFVPNPGGSSGVLCLGGSLVRFNDSVLMSGPSGVLSIQPNLTLFPNGQAVLLGETWYFQMWFRDALGGVVGSNTTRALRVDFN